jgi:ubiquinone/menaquinone biosynthesis C-methylase UbiE
VNRREIGQKFARLATNGVLRNAGLWRVFRPLIRLQFDTIASEWDAMRQPDAFDPYKAALAGVDPAPARALDLGTGTGQGAFLLARRFPDAEVVGADLSDKMLGEAKQRTPSDLRDRIRFEQADASALPHADGSFQLVAHANMIPFFDELARVVAPGGQALFAFSSGAETPIYVPPDRLREELGRRGFTEFADFAVARGTALLARKENGP